MKTNRLIHIEPAETIPVTCPHCAAALGMIDAQNLEQRMLWERESEPLSIEQPADAGLSAETALIRGACPACSAELAAFVIAFQRESAIAEVVAPPQLSLAMHGASFTAWALIEHTHGGVAVTEHLFGPILDEHAGEAFERLRELMPDLPRPCAVAEERMP